MTKRVVGTAMCWATVGVLVALTMKALAPSQEISNPWKLMDDSGKFGYVLGFMNASEQYQMMLKGIQSLPPDVIPKVIASTLDGYPIYVGGNLGVWKEKVDRFYQDPSNKDVHPVVAMQIVGLQLAGRPQAEIDRAIQSARKPRQ